MSRSGGYPERCNASADNFSSPARQQPNQPAEVWRLRRRASSSSHRPVTTGFKDAFASFASSVGRLAPATLKAIVEQVVKAARVEPSELEVPKAPERAPTPHCAWPTWWPRRRSRDFDQAGFVERVRQQLGGRIAAGEQIADPRRDRDRGEPERER